MNVREPTLNPIPIAALRPTQMTVGMREVSVKRQDWRERSAKKESDFLGRHMIPTVLGPKGRHFVIDNHHLARALHEEGVSDVLVTVEADLSALAPPGAWSQTAAVTSSAFPHRRNDCDRARPYGSA